MASSPSAEEVNASWSAPEDDGGQPVANYRYRYVKDDGDDRVDANNGDFTADTDTSLVTASTESGDLMHTIEVAATSALKRESSITSKLRRRTKPPLLMTLYARQTVLRSGQKRPVS